MAKCGKKTKYETVQYANQIAASFGHRVYKCHLCNKFHTTTMPLEAFQNTIEGRQLARRERLKIRPLPARSPFIFLRLSEFDLTLAEVLRELETLPGLTTSKILVKTLNDRQFKNYSTR